MKLAIIAPPNQLEWSLYSDYHLCLARVVLENSDYAQFYAERAYEGDFVILDNGAAEAGTLGLDQLLRVYNLVRPAEIVIPDKVNDSYETLKLLREVSEGLPQPLMFVPQGVTFDSWKWCLEQGLDALVARGINRPTLGISKYCPVPREVCLDHIEESGLQSQCQVHLLGVQTLPQEVRMLAEAYPWLRGIDTAAPVACGLEAKSVAEVEVHVGLDWHAGRPALMERDIIEHNIRTMLEWVNNDHADES